MVNVNLESVFLYLECAAVVSRRSCGRLQLCVCICHTQYVLFTLFCGLYTQTVMHDRKRPHCANLNATLTISTLTVAMRITPGCRPFVLPTLHVLVSVFHFFIAVLLALICSVIPPFPLSFPLSTPLIQLQETLTNAHAFHRQDAFPLVWLFQCHHLLSYRNSFKPNIGRSEDEE